MLPILQRLKEDQKKKVVFSRVLTNRMTITAWRLFKSDSNLHLGFIIYRLKRDFGFTEYEVANFTGIPVSNINNLLKPVRKLIDSDVIRNIAKYDYQYDEQLHTWRSLPRGHDLRPQGYYTIKDKLAWFQNTEKYKKRWDKESDIKLGEESEKEWNNKEYL